jgi:hypothetical protein
VAFALVFGGFMLAIADVIDVPPIAVGLVLAPRRPSSPS